jgi:hypothetical protein
MTITTDNETILRSVLDEWKAAADAHDPQRVAAIFTNDAIFQGLHPYSVGPQGVADYYASQPLGMTATYRILETRRPTDNLILAYLSVDFTLHRPLTVPDRLRARLQGEHRTPVEVHQVRKLADLARPGRPQPAWAQVMAKRRRKTLVVCQTCHDSIHARHPTATPTE